MHRLVAGLALAAAPSAPAHLLIAGLLGLTSVLLSAPSWASAETVVYFTDDDAPPLVSPGSIGRVGLDGSGLEFRVVTGVSTNFDFEIDPLGQLIYQGVNAIVRNWDLEGNPGLSISPNPPLPNGTRLHDIAINPQDRRLYFGNRSGGALARMELDGSNAEEISQPGVDIFSVALDLANGRVYYSDAAFGTQRRILFSDLDGSNPDLFDPLQFPVFNVGFNPVNGMIYFSDMDLGIDATGAFIKRMNPDGSNLSVVLSGVPDPETGSSQFSDFEFDPATGNLIVADSLANEIFITQPDGSGRTPLVTAIEPRNLAILTVPEPAEVLLHLVALASITALARIRRSVDKDFQAAFRIAV